MSELIVNSILCFICAMRSLFSIILIDGFGAKSHHLAVLNRLFGYFAVPKPCFYALSWLFTIT
ncbi:hypothetical protein [uncultured Shewanella sp.]|uniref:hypothetical protein n=1 Tax=uncultured Shewanella sp. TaxID=173975 RepID=UPI002609E9AF|nr:hypothetical protein [uncultured Shewanella sp.]